MAEDIVYQARLHWVIFTWPVVFFIFVVFMGFNYPSVRGPTMILGALVLLWALVTWTIYHFSSLTIKPKQVVIRTGFLVRQTLDIPLDKIESIDIRQSIWGTLLGYGALEIKGTGGTRELVNYLRKPLTCRRYIEQQMHG